LFVTQKRLFQHYRAKRSFGTEVCSEISEQVKNQRSARRAECCIECYCNVTRLRQETMRAAERIASELISSPRVGFPPPPQAAREAMLRALDLFRTTLIAKMLPVGQILSQALKPA